MILKKKSENKKYSKYFLEDKDEKKTFKNKNNCNEFNKEGYINKSDLLLWSVISIIGIIFSLIHAEQEYLWIWKGNTPEEAQSFKAKVIVSIISIIIGSSITALLGKLAIVMWIYFYKYKGISFSQMVAIINGHSLSNIFILTVGGWPNVIIILIIFILTIFTKQLGVVSMSIKKINIDVTINSITPNYTYCQGIQGASTFIAESPILGIKVINSIITPNITFTNEYYDNGIPENIAMLPSKFQFERILPYTDVYCKSFYNNTYDNSQFIPTITSNDTWNTTITIAMIKNTKVEWINCTIIGGYANALTTCENNSCTTIRTSNITKYDSNGNGLPTMLSQVKSMLLTSSSGTMNQLQSWLLGGSLTKYYSNGENIKNQSIDIVKSRAYILGNICSRVLCDNEINLTTNISQKYSKLNYYQYYILWKWPFWLISIIIFVFWIMIIYFMLLVPESRLISVEWLLNQYLLKNENKFGYLSGRSLAKVHENILLNITDIQPNNEIGHISILKKEENNIIYNIINNKKYR